MKTQSAIWLFALVAPLSAVPVFIGTNTGKNTESKGIYLADFDPESGKLSETKLVAEYTNPGFLALHPSKPILYACGQPKNPFPDGKGAVAAFSIAADLSLSFLGEASSAGQGPCHIAVDATGSSIAVANYGDGMVASLKIDENGIPGQAASKILAPGSGPTARQKGPHAHGVYFDKSNRHLFMPDLGADTVYIYRFDPATSVINPVVEGLKSAPGAGPRHLAFSPDEKHAYVINELDNTVLTATYDGKGGLKPTTTAPTLPSDFSGNNTTAEIEVHPNGNFVYASNRGHDSIAVFRRDPKTGDLTAIQHAPCGGRIPRHFKIAPGGKWLLCGHQDSHTISILPLDPETGKLGEATSTVKSPSPICILFK